MRELYARYEFRAALKELDASLAVRDASSGRRTQARRLQRHWLPTCAGDEEQKKQYELVLTQTQLDAWLENSQSQSWSHRHETTSLDPMRAEIVGVSFAVEPGHAAYVPLAHEYAGVPTQLERAAVLAALKPLLEDAQKYKSRTTLSSTT